MPIFSGEEVLLWKEKQIQKGGDDESLCLLLDLLGGISKKNLNILRLKTQKKIESKIDLKDLESIWQKHLTTFEPIQHLIGFCYWRDLTLQISNNVLIPRPETEQIIEIIFEVFRNKDEEIIFADLGTGSGAIAIALALANPLWQGFATDIDKKALELANKNLEQKDKVIEAKQAEANIAKDQLERSKVMEQIMSPLSGDKREVMQDLLQTVKTEKLKESFSKYLPAVMDNETKAKTKILAENRSAVTGNKASTTDNTGIDEMRKLAGI